MAEQDTELSPTLLQNIYSKTLDVLENTAEFVASYPIGQSILKQTDRWLWTVEKSAEWSVPNTPHPKHSDVNGTFGKPSPLVRPLPWLFFLPMLIFLRISRACLNLGAILIGVDTVKPAGVVRYIQVHRRRIRALKFLGLRRMRQRKVCQQQTNKNVSWRERLSSLVCYRANHNDVSEQINVNDVSDEIQSSSSVSSTKGTDLKRKYIEILKYDDLDWEDVEDEELMKKIDKLVDADSDEDPDFMPAEVESASDEDSESEEEKEDNAPKSPSKVLKRPLSHSSITTETITEENEDSDTTTVSANSDDESSRILNTPIKAKKKSPKASNKEENKTNNLTSTEIDAAVTSEEYCSPQNSMCPSPEPKKVLVPYEVPVPNEVPAQNEVPTDLETPTSLHFQTPPETPKLSESGSPKSPEIGSPNNLNQCNADGFPVDSLKTDNKEASENLINSEKSPDINKG